MWTKKKSSDTSELPILGAHPVGEPEHDPLPLDRNGVKEFVANWFLTTFRRKKKSHAIKVYWGLLMVGVVVILIAAMFEHPVVAELTQYDDKSVVFSRNSMISFGKEVGFALIIAWGVSFLIDRQATLREQASHAATAKEMSENVIHAVFGLQHAIPYVRKVVERTLQAKVIRTHYQVHYTIEGISDEEAEKLAITPGRFVKLTQRSSYNFRNVSAEDVDFTIRYAIAVRGGKLLDAAGITTVGIAGKQLSKTQVKKAMKVSEGYKNYAWKKTIRPGDHAEVPVIIEAVSFKELSDTEVWGNYHPTYRGMDMTLIIMDARIKKFGIRDLTATDAECAFKNGREAQWLIRGPILPNDSVVLWWRSEADDGGVQDQSLSAQEKTSSLGARNVTSAADSEEGVVGPKTAVAAVRNVKKAKTSAKSGSKTRRSPTPSGARNVTRNPPKELAP